MGDLTAGAALLWCVLAFVSAGPAPAFSAMAVVLLLLVVAAAPFKLFRRAEAALRGALVRFLGRSASPVPGATLEPGSGAALILACVLAKVDTAEAIRVATDARGDAGPRLAAFAPAAEAVDARGGEQPREGDVEVLSGRTSLEFTSWRISGLLRCARSCCCCPGVVVPTEAGNGFPK